MCIIFITDLIMQKGKKKQRGWACIVISPAFLLVCWRCCNNVCNMCSKETENKWIWFQRKEEKIKQNLCTLSCHNQFLFSFFFLLQEIKMECRKKKTRQNTRQCCKYVDFQMFSLPNAIVAVAFCSVLCT